ncbi:MAG: hypothetical protein KA288_01545 [Paludibacteraceae bacterium]|nr:hypothetical protein [Providencia rustigianii]MBP6436070.1 hypothetical protein [Paludibacteraceae bacterium]
MKSRIKENILIAGKKESPNVIYVNPRKEKWRSIQSDLSSIINLDERALKEITDIVKRNCLIKIKIGGAGNEK